MPALDLSLAARDLALARLEHLAEDDVLRPARAPPRRARARPAMAVPPRSVASRRRERAAHLPERRPRGAEDHGLGHRRRSPRVAWRPANSTRRLVFHRLRPLVPADQCDSSRRRARRTRPRTRAWSACSRASRSDEPELQRAGGLGRGEGRAQEGRRGARGRARRRPAPRAGRRPRQARRSSTPSRRAWPRRPPRRRGPGELGAVSLSWATPERRRRGRRRWWRARC